MSETKNKRQKIDNNEKIKVVKDFKKKKEEIRSEMKLQLRQISVCESVLNQLTSDY